MSEFELKGETYRVDKLDARTQFHLTRKLAPVIPALIPLFTMVAKKGEIEKALNGGDSSELAKAAEPLANALAGMSDEHADYVIDVCMQAVARKQGDRWMRVWSSGGSMFDDMELDTILPLCVRVLRENLGGFIAGLGTKQILSPTSP